MGWYKNIWIPKSIIVVLVNVTTEGRDFLAVKKSGKTQERNTPEHFDSLEELVKHFGKSVPYHLHVFGMGVLSRMVEESPQYREELVINGDPSEFMFSSVHDGASIAVSFCRKTILERELARFEEQKWHLYGVSCGESILCLPLTDETLSIDYEIEKDKGLLRTFARSEKPREKASWKGDYWKKEELLANAVHYQLIERSEQYQFSENEEAFIRHENYRQYSQFKWYGIFVVGGILLSLVINYFYQNHLNQQIADLEFNLSVHSDNLSMLQRLNQEKTRKEQLVISSGVNSTNFLSFYLDQIGKSVPASIRLEEMIVFPVKGKLKNKRKVEVDQKNIFIMGGTNGNEILDDWMEQLDRFEWVRSVELLNYLNSSNGGSAEFELMITLD